MVKQDADVAGESIRLRGGKCHRVFARFQLKLQTGEFDLLSRRHAAGPMNRFARSLRSQRLSRRQRFRENHALSVDRDYGPVKRRS